MEKLLAGDTALITGAASGIGRAICLAVAREGARLVLTDVDAGKGESLATELRQSGVEAHFLHANLAHDAGGLGLLEATRALVGNPSLLVHSASPRRREADNSMAVDADTWNDMLGVNVRSGFLLAREAGRQMAANGIKGRMLFITSLHAESPRNLPHYSASKAAQTMVVKELARALGRHGIRVNAIAPGAIPGGGFDAAGAGIERLTRCTSLGRLGKPEEVAEMAIALLSERFSSYVTGTTVVVDGGIALHNWIEPFEV